MGEEPNKEPEKAPEGVETDLTKLSEQVSNLNNGIAKYRDENKTIKGDLTKALDKITELTKGKDEDEDVLSPADEKKFAKLLEKKGVVLHADLQKKEEEARATNLQSVEKTATDTFLQAHPEYDENSKWQEIVKEFSLYKTPETVEGFTKILEKIHTEISGTTQRSKGKAEARAEDHKNKSLSLGGGSQNGGNSGDDESEDMDKLRAKYPNLSEDQIRETLNDITNLYPNKDNK